METKFRVWWWRFRKGGSRGIEYIEVKDVDEAKRIIKELKKEDLENPFVSCNAGGLKILEKREWSEYHDEEGRDILEIIENEEVQDEV